MGVTPSKQTFDDIVLQLRQNDITVLSTHSDKRYKYAGVKKGDMLFVVRECIKTETFSLRHAERGTFPFDTVQEALDILNLLVQSPKNFIIDATLWDAERYDERELRFTFHTYDLPQAAKEYEILKAKLATCGIALGQLTPKLQAITTGPYSEVETIKKLLVKEFGITWQDFSKKPQKVAVHTL